MNILMLENPPDGYVSRESLVYTPFTKEIKNASVGGARTSLRRSVSAFLRRAAMTEEDCYRNRLLNSNGEDRNPRYQRLG